MLVNPLLHSVVSVRKALPFTPTLVAKCGIGKNFLKKGCSLMFGLCMLLRLIKKK